MEYVQLFNELCCNKENEWDVFREYLACGRRLIDVVELWNLTITRSAQKLCSTATPHGKPIENKRATNTFDVTRSSQLLTSQEKTAPMRLSSYLVVEREERPRPVERLSLALREPDYNFVPVVFIVCVVGATMLVESELGLLYTVVSRIKGLIVHSGAPDCTRGHNSLRRDVGGFDMFFNFNHTY
uniref:RGS domain-containing protein n=1 Tax=Heterorhabditis bacteriophora TaxID=37862 RepID=A0A1I7WAP3_HETBA